MNTLARVLLFFFEGLHVCHCQAENEMGRTRIAQNWAENVWAVTLPGKKDQASFLQVACCSFGTSFPSTTDLNH